MLPKKYFGVGAAPILLDWRRVAIFIPLPLSAMANPVAADAATATFVVKTGGK